MSFILVCCLSCYHILLPFVVLFFHLRIKLVLDSQYIFGLISYFLSVFALDRICFYHYQFRRKVEITESESRLAKKQAKHKQNVFFHVFSKKFVIFSFGLFVFGLVSTAISMWFFFRFFSSLLQNTMSQCLTSSIAEHRNWMCIVNAFHCKSITFDNVILFWGC